MRGILMPYKESNITRQSEQTHFAFPFWVSASPRSLSEVCENQTWQRSGTRFSHRNFSPRPRAQVSGPSPIALCTNPSQRRLLICSFPCIYPFSPVWQGPENISMRALLGLFGIFQTFAQTLKLCLKYITYCHRGVTVNF